MSYALIASQICKCNKCESCEIVIHAVMQYVNKFKGSKYKLRTFLVNY